MNRKQQVIFYLLLFITLLGMGCRSKNVISKEKEEQKAIYINEFRLDYLRALLKKAYNNSDAIQEILAQDQSGFAEPVLTEDDYVLIDSLTALDNEKMKIDSIEGVNRAEGAQGKLPLENILNKFYSGFIDSFAIQRYEIQKDQSSMPLQ